VIYSASYVYFFLFPALSAFISRLASTPFQNTKIYFASPAGNMRRQCNIKNYFDDSVSFYCDCNMRNPKTEMKRYNFLAMNFFMSQCHASSRCNLRIDKIG